MTTVEVCSRVKPVSDSFFWSLPLIQGFYNWKANIFVLPMGTAWAALLRAPAFKELSGGEAQAHANKAPKLPVPKASPMIGRSFIIPAI
ncbi:MAG: hypothetical protein ACI9DF_003550 [Verrucomicrobiales bacterium]|jgi:hypothetical protein